MKRRFATVLCCAGLLAAALAALPPGGAASPLTAIPTAEAAVSKSLGQGGGGGDVDGAMGRLGEILSSGAPLLIAVAGWFLLSALVSRNIGAAVGVVLVTLLALIFLLSPQSIESFAKGIASKVF